MRVFGLVFALFAGGLTYVIRDTPVVTVVRGGAEYNAKTECNEDGSFTVTLAKWLPPEQEKYAIVHEMTHVKQIHRLGCKVAYEKYEKDPVYRFKVELEAYCNEVRARVKDGLELSNPIPVNPNNGERMKFSFFMYFSFGKYFGRDSINSQVRDFARDSTNSLISKYCPELAGL